MASQRRVSLLLGLSFLSAALLSTACSQVAREFGAGGEGGGATTGGQAGADPTTTSAGGGGVGGGGQGGGGAPPGPCTPGMAPWGGALCGGVGSPCKVLIDEVLPSPPVSRIGPPSIAVDQSCSPQILFENNLGGFNGFYAVRGASDWAIEPTPFEITTSGFALAKDGTPIVVSNDGTLWQKAQGQWVAGASAGQAYLGSADAFALDDGGAVHAGFFNYMDNGVYYGRVDPGAAIWSLSGFNDKASGRVDLAISPKGDPHMTYWSSTGGNGWDLKWVAPGKGAAEVAVHLGSNVLEIAQHELLVAAGDAVNPVGQPHVLYMRSTANQAVHELVVAKRLDVAKWDLAVLDTENTAPQFCTGQPMQGQKCNFDYEQLAPLGIVGSTNGVLRYVYGKIHHTGTSVGQCPNPPMCFWEPTVDNSVGQVFFGWFGPAGKPFQVAVVDKVIPSTGRVVLDTIGRIHLALLDSYPPTQGGFSVRYFEIGP